MKKMTLIAALLVPSLLGTVANAQTEVNPQLTAALNNDLRQEANLQRDVYRHPGETLTFFGIKPTDTVIELWPGGLVDAGMQRFWRHI